MAALSSNSTSEKSRTTSGPDNDFWAGQGPVVLRDPAIKLLSPVSGLEPLSWAEDHRLAASSANSVSVMELVCDIHSLSQNLVLHRSHIPVPDSAFELKVKVRASARWFMVPTHVLCCSYVAKLKPCFDVTWHDVYVSQDVQNKCEVSSSRNYPI